ncbi:MAG: restriction endonuclease, partial [Clostridiales bacterium]|nr:restriction endonuclease [Clostridiales bacterium]
MNKRAEAKQILLELQVPPAQQSDVCCFALLALAGMSNNSAWNQASNEWLRIHDIMSWTRKHYDVDYAENSRETFRKQAIHHFRNAAFIEDNGKATNSPNYRYRLTDEMLALLRSFGGEMWQQNKDKFTEEHESLISQYASKKSMRKMPVKI